MTDAGILPRPGPEVAAADATTTPAPETAAAVGEPALDVTPPEDLIAATFGLLRAEPDGSVVIAGSGTPGSQVEIYSNGVLLGTATVESSGDWVFVPDAPIAPGGTEITLAEAGKTGRAAQSFVVVINDDKASEPLVVASAPGAASEILQGLDRPAAESPTQLAAV
ncbi:MAG: Ig-like domain-containing protein, partial [Ferrovibrio sp.]